MRSEGAPRLVVSYGWAATAALVLGLGTLMMTPPAHGAARFAARLMAAVTTVSRHAPTLPRAGTQAQEFPGTPPLGALFTEAGGQLGHHFCSASVVDSPHGDLVITAAHCLAGHPAGTIEFVPEYHAGATPFGVWRVTRELMDSAWLSSANPDDDVAFLVVHQAGNPRRVQAVTGGGETLGTGWPARVAVTVAGYPDSGTLPVECHRHSQRFGHSQMKFVCGGFTGGTSGGPFLTATNPSTGLGTLIGVIGGYERGGDLPSVSYSPRFGAAVRALYSQAVQAG